MLILRLTAIILLPVALSGCATEPSGLIHLRETSTDQVWFRLIFDAGSAYDPPGREGLAHSVGTSFWIAPEQPEIDVSESLASFGAQLDISIDREVVTIDGQCSKDMWVPFSEFCATMLRGQRYDSALTASLVSYQMQLLEEGRTLDTPICRDALQARIYRDHPYGHSPHGSDSSLAAITAEDLAQFYQTHYTNSNFVLGTAGNITSDEAATFQARLKEQLNVGPHVTPVVLPDVTREGLNAYLIEMPDPELGALCIGFPTAIVRGDSNFAAWYLASSYLGRRGGRLAELIDVQRDMSYPAWSYVEHAEPFTATDLLATGRPRRAQYFSIETQPRPINQHFLIRVILSEMETIKKAGVPAVKLVKTRAYLIEKITAEREDAKTRMRQQLDDLWLGIPGFSQNFAEALALVTARQIQTVARLALDPDYLQVVAVCRDGQMMASALLSDQIMSQYPTGINRSLLREADKMYLSYQPLWAPKWMRIIKAEELFR